MTTDHSTSNNPLEDIVSNERRKFIRYTDHRWEKDTFSFSIYGMAIGTFLLSSDSNKVIVFLFIDLFVQG